jgi:hypothetical protein
MTLLSSRVIRISTASLLAGAFIWLVGGAFRYLLIAADNQRGALIAWALPGLTLAGWRRSRWEQPARRVPGRDFSIHYPLHSD